MRGGWVTTFAGVAAGWTLTTGLVVGTALGGFGVAAACPGLGTVIRSVPVNAFRPAPPSRVVWLARSAACCAVVLLTCPWTGAAYGGLVSIPLRARALAASSVFSFFAACEFCSTFRSCSSALLSVVCAAIEAGSTMTKPTHMVARNN